MTALVAAELRPAARDARELVVIVPGLLKVALKHVPHVVSANLPHADVLITRIDTALLSNASAVRIADEISECIQARCDQHQRSTGGSYERIVLIGHSRGALFVRKAYVFACGQNHELWHGALRPVAKSWAAHVERIILLAGLQRGWSLSPKPPGMSWPKCLALRALDRVGESIGFGGLMAAIKKGSPFVANLRLQWMSLARSGRHLPVTIQILGDMDDIVSPGDNIDLQAGRNFVYLNAPRGTTHAGVAELDDAERERVFLRALLSAEGELKSEYEVPEGQRVDADVQQVVFIMHGIRDFGGWTGRLADVLRRKAEGQGRKIATIRSSYGYFPLLRFLLFRERQKNVRWFMDEYTEALARYPQVRSVDFAGHSNGTYLLASSLRRYVACSFGRAAFAGTVVPRDFEWNEIASQGRIGGIRNYVATGDWIVGVFPRLFEAQQDIGSAGLFGFEREPAAGQEFHYVKGGHGAAITAENLDSIASFLVGDEPEPPPVSITRARQSVLAVFVSKLNWLVWLALCAVVLGGLWFVAFGWSPTLLPYAWARVALFLGLLLLTLNSV